MKRIKWLLLICLILAVPTGVALAAPTQETVIETGETIDNDVTLLGDNLEIQAGATVNGDVVVFNGDALIAGRVNGDLVLFNGDLEATETAALNGECVLWNGTLTDDTGDGLNCASVDQLPNLMATLASLADNVPGAPPGRIQPPARSQGWVGSLLWAVANSVVLGGLAFLAGALLPNNLSRVQATIRRRPVANGTVGLLTAVAVPSLMVLLAIISVPLLLLCGLGLIGFALVMAMAVALAAGVLFGWISVGHLTGQWLARTLNLGRRPLPVTAAIGTLLLTLVVGLADSFLPLVGLANTVILVVGLGAVALTQFGTRPYPAVGGGAGSVPMQPDPDKVTAVLATLPDDPSTLKERQG